MSVSQHPIAARLERQVGEGTKLLATVMGLPLVDGIFPALVLAGALSSVLGIIEVGLLVFGGSATLAVVLAEMEGTRREQIGAVLVVGAGVMLVAAVETAVAPTIESALDTATFERFAALVILAIAAKTASATVGEYLPSPGVIVGLGLVASFDPSGFQFALIADPMDVARGVAAAGVGVSFALSVAVFGPWLRGNVDIDRFRFGSAVALGVLPLTILDVIRTDAPIALAVLAVTSLLALDPGGSPVAEKDNASSPPEASPATDGGDGAVASDAEADEVDDDYEEESSGSDRRMGGDRAPWL
ncbi:DUF5794 domain-containing protein [Halosegnis marinus]|uniref:DUF5794 domain-containing protein n=1 Tax=Halosegnis marinus TaxID=3034023 RepID=A0ABD5ZSJ1_9EURY|nr:DUF5794 domain-containing protein [Halosegnis sp. DT85]